MTIIIVSVYYFRMRCISLSILHAFLLVYSDDLLSINRRGGCLSENFNLNSKSANQFPDIGSLIKMIAGTDEAYFAS